MQEQLQHKLLAVRARLRRGVILQQLLVSLVMGSALGMIVGILRLATGGGVPAGCVWAILALAPVMGIVLALRKPLPWGRVAAAIDDHYGWNDTITTAWAIASSNSATPLQRVVLQMATPLCEKIEAGRVVAVRLPQGSWGALVLLTAAVAMSLCPTAWPKQWDFGIAGSVATTAAESGLITRAEPPPVSAQLAADSLQSWRPCAVPSVPPDGCLASLSDRDIVRGYFLAIQPRSDQRAP